MQKSTTICMFFLKFYAETCFFRNHCIFKASIQPRDTYGRDFQDQRRLRDDHPVHARRRQNQEHPLYGRMQRKLEGNREALRRHERRRYRGKAPGQHLQREADIVCRSARSRGTRERSLIQIHSLSFLEYDDFCIGAVLAIFAHENVVFVAGDSKAAAFVTNLFDLVSPVACVIV